MGNHNCILKLLHVENQKRINPLIMDLYLIMDIHNWIRDIHIGLWISIIVSDIHNSIIDVHN